MAQKPKLSFRDALRKDMGLISEEESQKKKEKSKQEEQEEQEQEEQEKQEQEKEEQQEQQQEQQEEEEGEEGEEGEEKEEDEEDEEDEELELTRKKSEKKRKTKGDQIRDLRTSRDKYKKELEDLQTKYDSVSKSASEEGAEILSLIEDKFGELGSSTKEKIESLTKVLEEKNEIESDYNAYKRQIDITSSKEWKEDFEQPLNDSIDTFYALIVNPDSDGTIPNEELFKQFGNSLVSGAFGAGEINATQVRTAIDKFAEVYEKSTGEEYIKPSIGEVVRSVRSAINIRKKANDAYQDWEKNAKSRAEKSKIDESEKSEKVRKIEKRERKSMAQKALNSFNVEDLEDIIEEEDIVGEFRSVHNDNESQIDDPTKAMPYGDLVSTIVKGRLFDSLLSKYKSEIGKKEIKKEVTRGVKGSDKFPSKGKQKEKRPPGEPSWLGPAKQFGIKR